MPNIERLKAVREQIIKHKDRFDYTTFMSGGTDPINECGTVGCIAGFATAMYITDGQLERMVFYSDTAGFALDLNPEEKEFLFYPSEPETYDFDWNEDDCSEKELDFIEAISKLDHLIAGLSIESWVHPGPSN